MILSLYSSKSLFTPTCFILYIHVVMNAGISVVTVVQGKCFSDINNFVANT